MFWKKMANKTNNYNYPDKNGRFGSFGGRYVSETLISALEELESLYKKVKNDKKFQKCASYPTYHNNTYFL